MIGESDLETLLKHMEPKHIQGEYVFCSIDPSDVSLFGSPLLTFQEAEGLTVVLLREVAELNKLQFEKIWGLITLQVHSDLSAVGFLAEISHHLAKAGVSVNIVSAYYHDHLFVPFSKVDKAMEILTSLSAMYSD
ncbi:MAG: ACT domain-containing protein [Candidatus Thorarchaeota archaeon]